MSDSPAAILVDPTGNVLQTEDSPQSPNPLLVVRPQFSMAARDAFGRLRVSSPQTLLNTQFQFTKQDEVWGERLASGGTATLNQNSSSVDLTVTTASGSESVRQTRRYFRYRPGKSQLIFLTGVLGAGQANTMVRAGYFDDQNGIFFELDGTTLNVVRRSFVTGSAVDTQVVQAAWNLDPLDGTGMSGITIDTAKTQIFVIDIEWLGVGSVRLGIVDGQGNIVYCHRFEHANIETNVYMTTANLPVRYEVVNTGVAAASYTLKQICSTVISEGGADVEEGRSFVATSDPFSNTTADNNQLESILTLRPKATLAGLTNRAEVVITSLDVIQGEAGDLEYQIRLNPTASISNFVSADPESAVEYSRDKVTISDGRLVDAGFISSTNRSFNLGSVEAKTLLYLTLDLDGLNPATVTLALRGLGRTVDVRAVIRWKEVY